MIKPSFDKVKDLAGNYDIIPICKEIYADLVTPITLLRRIAKCKEDFFLLESIEGGEKWGRYSFLGFNPKARIHCKNGVVTVEGEGVGQYHSNKPLEVLREYLKSYKTPKLEGIPPFTGGLVGYYGYNMLGYCEPVLNLKSGEFNDFDLLLADKVIAYDHLKQKIIIIVNMKTNDLYNQYEKALNDIQEIIDIITDHSSIAQKPTPRNVSFKCNFSKENFCKMVDKTKQYIYDGDIFQCVVSRRFEAEYNGSLLDAYRVLRTTNPSPYMVFMKLGGKEIMCSSPETLVRLKNGKLSTYPIAGSRPRGIDSADDDRLEAELLSDEKELSEHNMLVDLGRNDIGKIAKIGSVEVTEYCQVHRYSKIMHICSEVEGDIRDNKDAFDAIEALLPAGTLSGAPKIRAAEIIEELEPEPRNIYGGAIGYVDFSGNTDVCIAIRMAVKSDNKVYVQAGAGIVADSVPESEYEETANKAKAVINAIETAAEVQMY